jgi:hypothetical protein
MSDLKSRVQRLEAVTGTNSKPFVTCSYNETDSEETKEVARLKALEEYNRLNGTKYTPDEVNLIEFVVVYRQVNRILDTEA